MARRQSKRRSGTPVTPDHIVVERPRTDEVVVPNRGGERPLPGIPSLVQMLKATRPTAPPNFAALPELPADRLIAVATALQQLIALTPFEREHFFRWLDRFGSYAPTTNGWTVTPRGSLALLEETLGKLLDEAVPALNDQVVKAQEELWNLRETRYWELERDLKWLEWNVVEKLGPTEIKKRERDKTGAVVTVACVKQALQRTKRKVKKGLIARPSWWPTGDK
jgi:hypothetical protein